MRRLIVTHTPKEDYVMQWNKQAGNNNKNLKVKIYFTLSELSTMKIVMWDFHVDESAKSQI